MLYTQIHQGGSPKSVTGTAEGSLLGSTPGSDYIGSKQWFDALPDGNRNGYLGGGYFSTKGVSSAGIPTNTYKLYIGSVVLFSFNIDQEADEIIVCTWRTTCVSKSGDTLTLRTDFQVQRGEYMSAPQSVDASVDEDAHDGQAWLDVFDLTVTSSGIGQGAAVRQIIIT